MKKNKYSTPDIGLEPMEDDFIVMSAEENSFDNVVTDSNDFLSE